MDIFTSQKGYKLFNLGKINIILGKNGCGKSSLLREVERFMRSKPEIYEKIRYITPERGGTLIYNPGTENEIINNPQWLDDTRRKNRTDNFRQQSIAQWRNLEMLHLRKLESEVKSGNSSYPTFDDTINKLNTLLDNIALRRDGASLKLYNKETDTITHAEDISSGEAELVSLGIECLVFKNECNPHKINVLLLDSPDVHIHADLQAQLSHFLKDIAKQENTIIIVATHDTAMVGALSDDEDTHIEFMSKAQRELNFKKISEEFRKILPIFGAHPLSSLFNKTPPFLVEGDDDERIWQQAVRTSQNKLKIYPCSTNGIDNMEQYEKDMEQIINSIYNNPKAFSLRDRDDGRENIHNFKSTQRFILSCRSSENLLLTDEVLALTDNAWEKLEQKIEMWLNSNNSHIHYHEMLEFKESGYDRKNFNLKKIRNDLLHLMGSPTSWEVLIGKTLGKLIKEDRLKSADENSIYNYLGQKLGDTLIKLSQEN